MGDYPDYTELMQIIGSDIMVPIDVQGAYIMMPIDIQAQYITLDIDIVAQTIGNLSVNIAAASVESINVDITAQTVGDIAINITAQNLAIKSQPIWSVLEGEDKSLRGTATVDEGTWDELVSYTVPAGKTFYITDYAVTLTNPLNYPVSAELVYNTTYLDNIGHQVGCQRAFLTPKVVPTGETIKLNGYYHNDGGSLGMIGVIGGFEI